MEWLQEVVRGDVNPNPEEIHAMLLPMRTADCSCYLLNFLQAQAETIDGPALDRVVCLLAFLATRKESNELISVMSTVLHGISKAADKFESSEKSRER